jgi:CTP synthase
MKIRELSGYNGIVVPGGFGNRGVEGKIRAIGFARKKKIPYLGLCYGMQLAVVEAVRSLTGFKDAQSTEVNPGAKHPVIDILPEQKVNLQKNNYGGSMRLGAYSCNLKKGTISRRAYQQENISERHRHRYELNNNYREILEKTGFCIAGVNSERNLVEIIELRNHPFFVAVQFHPEFKSRPLKPHPLFKEFIRAAKQH